MCYNLQVETAISEAGGFLSPLVDNLILVVDKGPQWQKPPVRDCRLQVGDAAVGLCLYMD